LRVRTCRSSCNGIHTNTIEGVFSIFKRGNHRTALGVEDNERTVAAIKGGENKRLTYRQLD
jgi:hypothetical protein